MFRRTLVLGAAIGQLICSDIAKTEYTKDEVTVRTSLSIGVSSLPDDGATVTELTRRADEAMYRAKRDGRNRVSV